MRPLRLAQLTTLLAAATSALALMIAPAPAVASNRQLAMLQVGPALLTDPSGTLDQLHSLGVGVVRVIVQWSAVAPEPNSKSAPRGFNGANPASYPGANWAPYDEVVRDAKADGIAVDLTPSSGAPLWAQGPGIPAGQRTSIYAWKPSPKLYGAFVTALGRRYDGTYKPPGAPTALPRVSFWALWNEPNFGKNLAPQATSGSSVSSSAAMYRTLVDSGWKALQNTHHLGDTILIGSLAARGQQFGPRSGFPQGLPASYGTTKPQLFTRALYCVDSRYRQLRGNAARAIGCPTTVRASRGFRNAHPGLFRASGYADHPYPINLAPNKPSANDANYTEFSQLPQFASALDRLQRTYGSRTRFPIYITEYGYITNPPNRSNHYVSPTTAAAYINWAEYLEWRNPRIATTMQFPLTDPNPREAPEFGGFASGLQFFGGAQKPAYNAYRLPLYLPLTTTRRGQSLEVWGGVRPAHLASGPQSVSIQFQNRSTGAFTTIKTVAITSPRGYFDVHMTFPGERLGPARVDLPRRYDRRQPRPKDHSAARMGWFRAIQSVSLGLGVALGLGAIGVPTASASSTQEALFQDGGLLLADPGRLVCDAPDPRGRSRAAVHALEPGRTEAELAPSVRPGFTRSARPRTRRRTGVFGTRSSPRPSSTASGSTSTLAAARRCGQPRPALRRTAPSRTGCRSPPSSAHSCTRSGSATAATTTRRRGLWTRAIRTTCQRSTSGRSGTSPTTDRVSRRRERPET